MLLSLALDHCGNVEHITTLDDFIRIWSNMIGKPVKYIDAEGNKSAAIVVEDHGQYVNLAILTLGFDKESKEAKINVEAKTSVYPWKQEERESNCFIE